MTFETVIIFLTQNTIVYLTKYYCEEIEQYREKFNLNYY